MRISKETIEVLKNISLINDNFYWQEGNTITSLAVAENIFVQATVKESIDSPIWVYSLNDLINVMSISENPELRIGANEVIIDWGNSKARYGFCDPELIKVAVKSASKKIKFPEAEINFEFEVNRSSGLLKATAILKTPYLSIFSENGKVCIKTYDKDNVNSNSYQVDTGTETDYNFNMILDIKNLVLLNGLYDVSVSGRGISRWKHKTLDVVYYITMDESSEFGG